MNAEFPPCRHVLSAMGFFVFTTFYALRSNLSVAIIEMVNSTYLCEFHAAAAAEDGSSNYGRPYEHDLLVADSHRNSSNSSVCEYIHNVRIANLQFSWIIY